MQHVDDFHLGVVFNSVRHTLQNEVTSLSPNSLSYVRDAQKFVDKLVSSLDSLCPPTRRRGSCGSFVFLPNLEDVIRIRHLGSDRLDAKILDSVKAYFRTMRNYLAELEADPQALYGSERASELLDFVARLADIYSPSYRVLSDDYSVYVTA
ncbi:MAG: hypothetical protein BWY10_01597 [Chloroflexi bacterium ADurb.Bin180]|nr:MAG: hypothetical protein BWY10_01597 [Chloroflexi bacterium ADurb.Bin180]